VNFLIVSALEASPWGGSEELWSATADVLIDRGAKVTICVKAWPSVQPKVSQLAQRGALIRFRRPKGLLDRILRRRQDQVAQLLSSVRADLVVVSQGSNFDGHTWMKACKQVGTPYVSISHAVLPWFWPPDGLAEELVREYSGARRAFFVSRANMAATERQLGTTLSNGVVIRNPVSVPYDIQLPWPEQSQLRWACVARLDTYVKGIDILIDVLGMDKWRMRPLVVTLYGRGSNEKALRKAKASLGLANLEFGGFIADPVDIWRNNHCLVLPSRAEGLPITIVEAMLCGRPCIVTDVAGNTELLADNCTGFVAADPTVSLLDEAMERAWRSRERWKEMGAAASASVRVAVPPNPAAVFADQLWALASHSTPVPLHA
jgi:glycosyltransferase involved in cell wall biosynthesis